MGDHDPAAQGTRGRYSGGLATGLSAINVVTRRSKQTMLLQPEPPSANDAGEAGTITGSKRPSECLSAEALDANAAEVLTSEELEADPKESTLPEEPPAQRTRVAEPLPSLLTSPTATAQPPSQGGSVSLPPGASEFAPEQTTAYPPGLLFPNPCPNSQNVASAEHGSDDVSLFIQANYKLYQTSCMEGRANAPTNDGYPFPFPIWEMWFRQQHR